MLFSATNELAFHVPNPEAAEDFYTKILGCTVELQAVGCTLVPIGPHASDEHYIRDPNGIVFDVVERREII